MAAPGPHGLLATAGSSALARWGWAAVAVASALLSVEIAYQVLRRIARRQERAGRRAPVLLLVGHTKRSVQALAVSVALAESVRFAPAAARTGLAQGARVVVILAITWIVASAGGVAAEVAERRFDTRPSDSEDARRALTQLRIVRRVVTAVIVVIGGLAALTSLPEVRTVGASLLASAGVLGIVAGIAGQSTLGNVIAGLQVAFSDALRLDDVVVVQGTWGTVEQITLTYVIVRTWDERRLVLPVSSFVTTPFENWTRTGAELLGSILLFVDFTVPVEELRAELLAYLDTHPLWDRRVASLQVVDATEGAAQVRSVVSAATSGDLWDLRCAVREHLIAYLRDHHPGALPRLRLRMSPAQGGPLPGEAAR